MLLGELLVKNKIITQMQLNQALKAHDRYPNQSIGQVVSKVFNIPLEIIETTMLTKSVIPKIEVWFKKNIDQKPKTIPPSSTIKTLEININSYTRYEGESVTFVRNEMGYYCEEIRDTSLEKLAIVIEEIRLTTRRNQVISLKDINIEISLGSNNIKAENPGFITEARLKLLQAMKQKNPV